MPLSLVSLNETKHNISSICGMNTYSDIGGATLPPANTYDDSNDKTEDFREDISIKSGSSASMSGDLSSQSSEYEKTSSPINRQQLHYGFNNRQVTFSKRRPGPQIMRAIDYPTLLYEYDGDYDQILRRCFEEEEEVMVLVFEDAERELLVLASFVKYFLDQGEKSAELCFFNRKGRITTNIPEEVTLHFVDFLRCSRSAIDTREKRGVKRLRRLVKRDVQSCIIHDKMCRKRQIKQLRNTIAAKRYSQVSTNFEEQKKEERFAWLSEGEFRDIFGVSIDTVKEVIESANT